VEHTTGVRWVGELRKRRKIMLHPSEGDGIVIVETTRQGRMKDHATFAAPGVAVFTYTKTALLTLATTRPRTEAEAARIPDAENIDRRDGPRRNEVQPPPTQPQSPTRGRTRGVRTTQLLNGSVRLPPP